MKRITEKQINTVIATLDKETKNPIQYILDIFEEEQPAIFEYVHGADQKLNKDENDLLFTTALTGWYIVRETLGAVVEVSDDFINERLAANIDLFEGNIDDRVEGAGESPLTMLSKFNNQKTLMQFLASLIIDRPENFSGTIRDEALLPMVLNLKTVIDCLVLHENEGKGVADKTGEYSEKEFEEMKKTIDALFSSYKESAFYMNLGQAEKEEAEFIVTSFSEMMYNYYLMKPADWKPGSAIRCCIDILPRKVMADISFFESVEPVLKSFLAFASENGAIPAGAHMAAGLNGIGEAIMERAEDPETWGPGKALLKSAAQSGVDISDGKELEKFITRYNKGMEKKRSEKTPFKKKVPGRNDPCPCGSGKKYKKCCGAE